MKSEVEKEINRLIKSKKLAISISGHGVLKQPDGSEHEGYSFADKNGNAAGYLQGPSKDLPKLANVHLNKLKTKRKK